LISLIKGKAGEHPVLSRGQNHVKPESGRQIVWQSDAAVIPAAHNEFRHSSDMEVVVVYVREDSDDPHDHDHHRHRMDRHERGMMIMRIVWRVVCDSFRR
jgi:hypothetical protein